jgi:hypothetical protein
MSLTSFGPFSSLEEALAWQEEMRDKVSDCTVLEPIRADYDLLPWYGFSYLK